MTRTPRPFSNAAALVSLALILGSCSRVFDIEVSGYGPNIRLEFRDGGLLPACLKELNVYEAPGTTGQPQELVWNISATAGCVTLTGIDIGHIPEGFQEGANRLPLKTGGRYQADALAEKDYPETGMSSHWFVCQRTPQEAGWQNDHQLRELPSSCSK